MPILKNLISFEINWNTETEWKIVMMNNLVFVTFCFFDFEN